MDFLTHRLRLSPPAVSRAPRARGGRRPVRRRKAWGLLALLVIPLTTCTGGCQSSSEGVPRTLPGSEEGGARAFSPDGRALALGPGKGRVRLWDPAAGQERPCSISHPDTVWSLAFSPDGKHLASGSRDETVRLWDATTGRETDCLRHDGWV